MVPPWAITIDAGRWQKADGVVAMDSHPKYKRECGVALVVSWFGSSRLRIPGDRGYEVWVVVVVSAWADRRHCVWRAQGNESAAWLLP